MDDLPKQWTVSTPFFHRDAGERLDPRAGKLKAEIGSLVEDDARPSANHVLQLSLGAQEPHVHAASGAADSKMFVPGGLLELFQRGKRRIEPEKGNSILSRKIENERLVRLDSYGFKLQLVEGVRVL